MKINSFYFKNNDTGVSTVDFTGGNAKDVSQDILIENLQEQVNSLNSYLNTEYQRVPVSKVQRCIGEIVFSSVPLRDAGLHLLDGSRISGYGDFREFVDLIKSYYDESEISYVDSVEKHYNLTGSLTYEDGNLSGFKSDGYLQCTDFFKPDSNPWEKYLEFTTGASSDTSSEIIFGQNPEYSIKFGYQTGEFRVWISSNGSDWNVANVKDLGVQVQNNFHYYVKIQYTGSEYKFFIETSAITDTTEPILVIARSESFKSGYVENYGTQLGTNCFSGTLHLRGCYSIIHKKDKDEYVYIERVVKVEKITPKYDFIIDESTYEQKLKDFGVVGEFTYNRKLDYIRLPKISSEFDLVYTSVNGEEQNQEHHQYMYICIANGETLINNIDNQVDLINPFNLLDISNNKNNENNLAWLKADGKWQTQALYPSLYDRIKEIGVSVESEDTLTEANDFDFVYCNDKFRLPTKTTKVRFLVECKKATEEDPSYYELYSDGYCVQGGAYTTGTLTTFSINFEKKFINKLYNFIIQTKGTPSESTSLAISGKELQTVTCMRSSENTEYEYRAEGYCEVPDSNLYYYAGSVTRNANLIDVQNLNLAIKDIETKFEKSPRIIKTYTSGTSGYVIYSNGFCIQWGSVQGRIVTLPVRMKDSNYGISLSISCVDPSTTVRNSYWYNPTAFGFDIWDHWQGGSNNNYSTYLSSWQVFGICDMNSSIFESSLANTELAELKQNTSDISDIKNVLEELKARIEYLENTGTKVVDELPEEPNNDTTYIVRDSD